MHAPPHPYRLIVSCRGAVVVAFVAGCSGQRPSDQALKYPEDLVGQWVRFRQDSTWGDTLTYQADGRVLGSVGHPVPPSARWGVRRGPGGTTESCAGDDREGACQTYRFEDSIMVVGGGPQGPSYFRRVR